MIHHWRMLLVLLCLGTLLGLPAWSAAQTDPALPRLIFARQGDLWTADADGQNARLLADGHPFDPLGNAAQGPTYHLPLALPESQTVIFADWFDSGLWRVPLDGSQPPARLSDAAILQPFGLVAFPGEQEIGAVIAGERGPVFALIALTDGQTVPLADIPFEGGCGGGPYLPDSQVYDRQITPLNLILVDPSTLLVSMNCSDQGLQAIDLDSGRATVIDPTLRRARLSPDGARVAGIAGDAVRMIDLRTGDALDYAAPDGADLLAWTSDGHLIAAAAQEREGMALSPADESLIAEALAGLWPERVPLYDVSLSLLNLERGTVERLWSTPDARGVAALAIDDNVIYFSLVDNLAGLAEALNAGRSRAEVLAAWPGSAVHRLSVNGGSPELIAPGGESPVVVAR